MNKKIVKRICFTILTAFIVYQMTSPCVMAGTSKGTPSVSYAKTELNSLRMPFLKNSGHLQKEVAFWAKTFNGTLFVTQSGDLVYALNRTDGRQPGRVVIKESLKGGTRANPSSRYPSGVRVNFFKGADPKAWQISVAAYDEISLGNVYKGIELTIRAYQNNVEKLYHVMPGADPAQIAMTIDGAQKLNINENGELALVTGLGEVAFTKPVAYQDIDGQRKYIHAAYSLAGNSYGFTLGSYDKTKPLVIDPMFSTYLGGSDLETGTALAANYTSINEQGGLYVYVTGFTESNSDFPNTTGVQTSFGGGDTDVFVARLDHDLKVLDTTYVGGRGDEEAWDIAIHPETDEVYVAGFTDSTDFPDAPSNTRGSETDGFIVCLSKDLSTIEHSRYLGGRFRDYLIDLDIFHTLDGNPFPDAVFATGRTFSDDLPATQDSAQPDPGTYGSVDDGFVARLNLDLSLQKISYLGGCSADTGLAVAVHTINGHVYVVGRTAYDIHQIGEHGMSMGCFPGLEPSDFGGQFDGFVVHMPYGLSEILDVTYLGGVGIDTPNAIDINTSSNTVYVAGGSISKYDSDHKVWVNDFPVHEGYQTTVVGSEEAFVTRFSSTLDIEKSTFLAGTDFDRAGDVMLRQSHMPGSNVYISGTTRSSDLPGTENGASPRRGGNDAFVALFNDDLDELMQATYVGGKSYDYALGHGLGHGNASNGAYHIFLAGETSSDDFPGVLNTDTVTTAQPTRGGSTDAFVTRLLPDLTRGTIPDIELQPRHLDFDNICWRTTAVPITVTVENMGGGTLDVSDIFLTGADTDDFEIDFAGGTSPCGSAQPSVGAGEVCTVNVRFTPSVDNVMREAELFVHCNDTDEPVLRTTIQGYKGPSIVITDPPGPSDDHPRLVFPVMEIGTRITKTFTIKNECVLDLEITDIFNSEILPTMGPDFTLHYGNGSQACSDPGAENFILGYNQQCSVEVSFEPTYWGAQEALAIIVSNDLDDAHDTLLYLNGTGVEDLSSSVMSHDVAFHDVVIGKSRSLPLLIYSNGGEPLEIASLTLSDPVNFSLDYDGGAVPCLSTYGYTIPSLTSCSTMLTFHPQTGGTFNETLTITSNDPDNTNFLVTMTGRSGADSDGDNILDEEEAGDANNDGTDDSQQPHVASFHSYEGDHFVVLETDNEDTQLVDVTPMARTDSQLPDQPPSGYSFPFGFFHFTVNLAPGDTDAIVTITLPVGQTVDTYTKFGREACDTEHHYYDFGDPNRCPGAIDGLEVNANVLTLHLVDGGNGDHDLVVNSQIVDPGAPTRINDFDGDGWHDGQDNCPTVSNAAQDDADNDLVGDACDNCPNSANANQDDGDSDTVGDACDNCPSDVNTNQADADSDTVGNACDNCPNDANTNQNDGDSDTVGDTCDNCPNNANTNQADADSDAVGDACDNCLNDANTSQDDGDSDMVGDACDNCLNDANTSQDDGDKDKVGDACDNCPNDANTKQADADGDALGDICDPYPDDAANSPAGTPNNTGSGGGGGGCFITSIGF